MAHRFALLLLAASFACTRKLDGPAPAPTATAPAAACVAQKTTVIDLTGSGFSPLYTGALQRGQLELPAILLTRKVDLSGATVSDGPFTIPDDFNAPAQSHERWIDDGHLQFTVDPSLALTPGLYDVSVVNLQNSSGTLAGGLLAVLPPALTSITPNLACDAKGNSFILTGTDFLISGTKPPTVLLGTKAYTATASNCRALPGSAGIQSCTQLSITVPTGDLPNGDYPVVVVNPDPVGCQSSAPGPVITLVGPPLVTSVLPPSLCSQAAALPMVINGSGFVTIAQPGQPPVAPTVLLGTKTYASTPGGCSMLPHSPEAVQLCTSLVIMVNGPAFAVGSYPLTVTNPPPADCQSSPPVQVAVTPPPVVTALNPTTICSANDHFTLTGTGFEPTATVTTTKAVGGTVVTAASVTVNSAGTSAAVLMPSNVAPGNYQVALNNPDGCSANAPTVLRVIPGPIAFFVDPSTIYNGITVQATLYAGNISPPIQSITATPSGGGAATSLAFTLPSANRAQITIPKGLAAGSYDLTVQDQSSCPAILASAFSVVSQTTLTLASPPVNPPFGALQMATGVSILAAAGTSFVPVPRVYLNPTTPGPGTIATPLGAVAFVDATHLSALVPDSLPAGSYDVIVVNPDGKVAVATAAFYVADAAHPPPTITTVTPGSVINTGANLTLLGDNFRTPAVSLNCFDQLGALAAAPTVAIQGTPSQTSIAVQLGSTAAASCVVRVTDKDGGSIPDTYGEYSALVFTNSGQKLYNAVNGSDLKTPRRAPVALGGDATTAARFLHVMGGDNGNGGAFDVVETSALTFVGVPGAYFDQRNRLAQARAFAGGTRIGRWLYLAGGSSNGVQLKTVERAFVLDPASPRRTQITDVALDVDPAVGLAPGVYYYRVAAVMPAGDAFNPNGEELPSDPLPVRLPTLTPAEKFSVTLAWKSVAGAASYVVYRSTVAGFATGNEAAIATGVTGTTFTDSAAAAIAGAPGPLPVGSLGTWNALAFAMNTAREGAGVASAIDPSNPRQAYLYVVGGRLSNAVASDNYEYLPIALADDGSQPPGTIASSGGAVTAATAFTQPVTVGAAAVTIGGARWQLMTPAATNALSPPIPPGDTYLYAGPGLTAVAGGGTVVSTVTAAKVQAGGALGAFVSVNSSGSPHAGYVGIVVGRGLYFFGGRGGVADLAVDGGNINSPPPAVQNFSGGQAMNVARYLHGGTLHGAYVYIVGGLSSTAPVTAIPSTEYRVW